MRNKEKEDLMEAVFGKNAKRRTLGSLQHDGKRSNESAMLNEMLKKQSDELNQMMKASSFTESDYQRLKQEIEKDFGVSIDVEGAIKEQSRERKIIMNSEDSIDIEKKLSESFPGQETCVQKLVQAFSKPFILKNDSDEPMFVILLCGYPGTGKSEILSQICEAYYDKGYFKSSRIGIIDLSLYTSSEQDQVFVQDVYSAMQKGDIAVFKNFHQTSFYLMPVLEQMLQTGSLKLKKRYAASNGKLQETGTSLTVNAVDSLSFANKGIIFIADAPLSDLYEIAGTGMLHGFHDVIETNEFTDEALSTVIERKLQKLKDECVRMNLEIDADASVAEALKALFDRKQGLRSIDLMLEKWLKALLQLKVEQKIEDIRQMNLKIRDGQAIVIMDDSVFDLMDKKEQEDRELEQEILAELDEIVGLEDVKKYVLSLKDHFRIQKMRAQRGLKTSPVSMHMIFTGNPGTGKTTIARIISRYLKAIGILKSGQLVEVTRADLVGRYVGHTAPQTENVIHSALGGVLFIDEAYSLYRGKDDSFGLEAIDTLVKCMEDYRDELLVILAGYTKEMKEFLTSNSGLKSRFPNVIEFPDYTAQQLLLIARSIARSKQYVLHDSCDEKLLNYFEKVQAFGSKEAGNGRLARNLVEAAIVKQSTRCLNDETAALDELVAEDFELDEVI